MEKKIDIKPVREIPDQLCADLEFVFTDIDDTITKNGMMPFKSLKSIYDMEGAGIQVVLVTGRPAGWCDYFARMWPVSGIVGENGAFYFSYDRKRKKMKRVFLLTDDERKKNKEKLTVLEKRVLTEVPQCRISADQSFRITDLAIDISEDVESVSQESIQKICRIIEDAEAEYKVSSIHINCWYGKYDKLTCFDRFIRDFTGSSIEDYQNKMIYIGDSPNDEPMFANLENGVAVANIRKYLYMLKDFPIYITDHEASDGFDELVEIILKKRKLYK